MKWTYFLEHLSESPFSSADIGVCGNDLTLALKDTTEPESVSGTKLSHSALLNGEQKVEHLRIREGQLVLPLSRLTHVIHVFQISVKTGTKEYQSRVALLPAADLPEAYIVVGSPRSGTTVVGNMVQQAFQTKAHGEAHIAELFNNLVEKSVDYIDNSKAANNKGTLVWEMPTVFLKAQLVKQLRDIYVTYYGSDVVIDKTPGLPMLRALPLLLLAFPQAKVVYCQRRGIENVASRLRKFPNAKFEVHCKQWVQTIKVWERMKTYLSRLTARNNWWIEIEQFELATSPERVTKKLGAFLSLDKQAVSRMFEYQDQNSPQITGGKPSDVTSLDQLNWSTAQKQCFINTCGSTMKQQGYSMDESYYTTPVE